MRDARPAFFALLGYLVAASAFREIVPLSALVALAFFVAVIAPKRARFLPALLFLAPGLLGIPLLTALEEGLHAGAESFLRLIAFALGPIAFFVRYDARDLERLLLHLRLPAILAFAFTAALSFVPLVGDEIARVYDAERERGIPVDTPLGMLRNLGVFLVPILLACFRLAEDLAGTLVARGLARREIVDRSWKSLSDDLGPGE